MTLILEGYLQEQIDVLSLTIRTLLNEQPNHFDAEMVTFVGQYVFSLERDAEAASRHNRYDEMSAIIDELCDLVNDLSERDSSAQVVNKQPVNKHPVLNTINTTNVLPTASD